MNKGITFSYKNPDHAARRTFELILDALAAIYGGVEDLPQRTILIDFAPSEGGADLVIDENLIFDGCVGARITIKDCAARIYDLAIDPRPVESKFNELLAAESKTKLQEFANKLMESATTNPVTGYYIPEKLKENKIVP